MEVSSQSRMQSTDPVVLRRATGTAVLELEGGVEWPLVHGRAGDSRRLETKFILLGQHSVGLSCANSPKTSL